MGRKHKHEEHINHERWLVSFADMMTLLFALFVVLYAMSQIDLERLRKLKKSIKFAFNISGSGKTQDAGIFEKVSGAGDMAMPAPLVTAQDGGMTEFLKEELADFKQELGASLDVVITDDSISLTAPLSDFFEEGVTGRVREPIQGLLDRTIDGSLSFTSTIRIIIKAPNLPVYSGGPGRPAITSADLCYRRLRTLGRLARHNPQVRPSMVLHQFQEQNEQSSRKTWEQQARVTIVFSNTNPENR